MDAERIALTIERERGKLKSCPIEKFLFQVGSQQWNSKVLVELSNRGTLVSGTRQDSNTDGRWRRECDTVRAWLHEKGKAWAYTHPLEAARLRGLQGTLRQREVLECVLLLRCCNLDVDPREPEHVANAIRGLSWDISQNVDLQVRRHLRGIALPCVCTGSVVYLFEFDRIIHPQELAVAMGWASDTSLAAVGARDLMDLLGESQAMHSVVVATWALLLAVGNKFEHDKPVWECC